LKRLEAEHEGLPQDDFETHAVNLVEASHTEEMHNVFSAEAFVPEAKVESHALFERRWGSVQTAGKQTFTNDHAETKGLFDAHTASYKAGFKSGGLAEML
jgi:hypothetical protein